MQSNQLTTWHWGRGLSWDQLTTTLRIVLASGKATGLKITICNPRLKTTEVLSRLGRLTRCGPAGQPKGTVRYGLLASLISRALVRSRFSSRASEAFQIRPPAMYAALTWGQTV